MNCADIVVRSIGTDTLRLVTLPRHKAYDVWCVAGFCAEGCIFEQSLAAHTSRDDTMLESSECFFEVSHAFEC